MDSPKLAKAKLDCQREANKAGRAMCVINLNPFMPLYCVRESDGDLDYHRALVVFVAHPSVVDQFA